MHRVLLALLALLPLTAQAQQVIQPPAAAVNGTAPSPSYTANYYYPSLTGTVSAGSAITTGNMRLSPFIIPRPVTIDGLSVYVSTLASSGNATLHLYSALSGAKPTGTSANCTISTTTTGVKSCTFGAAVSITTPGVYWLGIEVDATASTVAIFQTLATSINTPTYLYGSATLAGIGGATLGKVQLSWSHTYGASGDITGATLSEYTGSTDALIYYHVSTIP